MSEKIAFGELVERISAETGADPTLIRDLIHESARIIEEGLLRDGKVQIQDFGTFVLQWVEPRTGNNPQTGQSMKIHGHSKVIFRPARKLKEYVNRRYRHLKPLILAEEPRMVTKEELRFGFLDQGIEDLQVTEVVNKSLPPEVERVEVEKEEITEPEALETSLEPVSPSYVKPRREKYDRGLIGVSILFVVLLFLVIYVGMDRYKGMRAPVSPTEPFIEKVEQPALVPEQALSESEPPDAEQAESQQAKPSGVEHIVQRGDNLWNLAKVYYDDFFLWPSIYWANLSSLEDPDLLDVGLDLIIPPLEGTTTTLTEEDRATIAQGYLSAYLAYKSSSKKTANYFLWVALKYDPSIIMVHKDEIDQKDLDFVQALK